MKKIVVVVFPSSLMVVSGGLLRVFGALLSSIHTLKSLLFLGGWTSCMRLVGFEWLVKLVVKIGMLPAKSSWHGTMEMTFRRHCLKMRHPFLGCLKMRRGVSQNGTLGVSKWDTWILIYWVQYLLTQTQRKKDDLIQRLSPKMPPPFRRPPPRFFPSLVGLKKVLIAGGQIYLLRGFRKQLILITITAAVNHGATRILKRPKIGSRLQLVLLLMTQIKVNLN